ncbi:MULTISPECIES: hypothetical protein [Bacillus cereus group]|uniref:Uncharacterized protein n=4 Tax=Bacillus thuringiensis TaxID=1428 RepID=B1N7C5_BACTU|nr:hypothetical protein [Bacillus thuringiensis]MEB9514623.1 hypothetical protein [Bacillus cereus]ABP73609.1 hypothetical protein [Bacillus thuringiensis]AEA19667.1 hypothetical protein CT43_P51051 [Bacillus thuringiensis serovar chinensis CT-43]ARP61695.1 hypothetical protein CAB88_32340 [Bacillus thuringiensis]ARP61767.1 hypothetical protein CAB88_32730 [Bacillus thuringiensis]
MNDLLFDNSDWCDICGDVIPSTDVKSMHIEGCEKTLCKSCRGEVELKLKVVETLVIKDMLTALTKGYGRDKVREFNLVKAERYVQEHGITLEIEKRGGKFNQEKLGVFVSLSTNEIIAILQYLQKKIGNHLWINAVVGALLDRGLVYTMQLKEGVHDDGTTDILAG